jgi:uncharacterized membrane protein
VQIVSTLTYLFYVIVLLHGNVSILFAILSAFSIFNVVLGIVVLGENILSTRDGSYPDNSMKHRHLI